MPRVRKTPVAPFQCPKAGTEKDCGRIHHGCRAHNRAGAPCGRAPAAGQGICNMHGAKTGSHLAKAARVLAEEKAMALVEKLLDQYDVAPVADPLSALAELAGEARRFLDIMGDLVNDLRADDIRYRGGAGAEQLRAELALYERAMDRLGKFLVDMARLNIDERLARITEAQATALVEFTRVLLAELRLSPEQEAVAAEAVPRHLRAIARGA